MGRTPDRHPGRREENTVFFRPGGSVAENGEVAYEDGVGFRFMEEGVEKGLNGTDLTQTQHKALRQLIHFISDGPADGFASGAYKEVSPSGPFPTSIIWWESSAKEQKIVERTVTWSGARPIVDEWKMYDEDGETVVATVTDSISYDGSSPFETSRSREISVP